MRTNFRVLDLVVVMIYVCTLRHRCTRFSTLSCHCQSMCGGCVASLDRAIYCRRKHQVLQFKTIDVLGLQACITMHQRSWCVFNCSLHSVRSMVLRFLTAAIGICGFQSVYSNHQNFRWHRCLYFEKPTTRWFQETVFFSGEPVHRDSLLVNPEN